ncbi:MAG: 4-(cytidine 5'-diphospho)-2-C-methyl-D-erythritol kinase, partial [Selenomonadaceae bacterium]|nr:4-(cytidine 5'-diphospho)-2-C-methyl-D-erythritol kinase [Selenomonadaceae bacterium]
MHLVTVHGNAKINLTLDILGTRPDGFHEVAMVMQSLALHDTVEMERTDGGISLELLAEDIYGGDTLEADESNLAWRAAALMQTEYGLRGGVRMRLVKRIPIAAGLAGGSTDAAAVLRGMNEL